MKITRIAAQNVLAIKAIDIRVERPAVLIAGFMEQGKSSVFDAIRLALLGEPGRVTKKKDWPALVRRGAEKGAVLIEGQTDDSEWSTRTSLPGGAIKSTGSWKAKHRLAGVPLQPDMFARGWTTTDRREALLTLLDVDVSGNEIIRRLIVRGADPEKVNAIADELTKFGAQRGHELAADKARQARADWKALAGEDYGDVKAETWVPTVPSAPNGTTLNGVRIELKAIEQNIAECNQEIGRLEAQRIAFEGHESTANGLRQRAGIGSRAQAALETAKTDLDVLTRRIASVMEAAADAVNPGRTRPCPSCGTVLEDDGETLTVHQRREPRPMPEDYGRIPDWRESVAMLERSIANHTRTVEDARVARSTLVEMEKNAPGAVSQDEIDEVRNALKTLQARQRELNAIESAHLDYETMVGQAADTRDRAAAWHRDVQDWKSIAELLSPDGVPAEILTEGLEPFRARLRQTALRTGWPVVSVRDDMEIVVGEDLYGLCSKSAWWRADAAIAEAISHLSGLKFLMLDGMDVLDAEGRKAFVGWISMLARTGEIEQCIVNGTFKARPGGGSLDDWQVEWMAAGEIEQAEEATA